MAQPARAMTKCALKLGYYACNPDIKVIAPWREWDLQSREKLIAYAEQNQIPVPKDKRGEAPFSVDANLLHTSSEGKVLEDPAEPCPEFVYQRTVRRKTRPTKRRKSPSVLKPVMPYRLTAKNSRPPRF